MLIISKVKLYLARGLFWAGLVGAILSGLVDKSFILLLVCLACGFLGAWLLDKVYTCPSCGYKLLRGNGGALSLKEQCPEKCPSCRTPIQIQMK